MASKACFENLYEKVPETLIGNSKDKDYVCSCNLFLNLKAAFTS